MEQVSIFSQFSPDIERARTPKKKQVRNNSPQKSANREKNHFPKPRPPGWGRRLPARRAEKNFSPHFKRSCVAWIVVLEASEKKCDLGVVVFYKMMGEVSHLSRKQEVAIFANRSWSSSCPLSFSGRLHIAPTAAWGKAPGGGPRVTMSSIFFHRRWDWSFSLFFLEIFTSVPPQNTNRVPNGARVRGQPNWAKGCMCSRPECAIHRHPAC